MKKLRPSMFLVVAVSGQALVFLCVQFADQAAAAARAPARQRHPDLELPERPHRCRDRAVRRQRAARRVVRPQALGADPGHHRAARRAAARRDRRGCTAAPTTSATCSAAYVNGGVCLAIAAGVILARGPLARFCQLDGGDVGPSGGPRDGGGAGEAAPQSSTTPSRSPTCDALTTRVEHVHGRERLGAAALAGDHRRTTPASACAGRPCDEGCDVVFVCGGDGTVMAAATAMARSGGAAGDPAGRHRQPAGPQPRPAHQRRGRVPADRRSPAGPARSTSAAVEDRKFVVMAGLGFDAAIMRDAPEGLKKAVGWPAYVVSATKHLRGRGIRVTITIDDGDAAAPTGAHRRRRQRRQAAGQHPAAARRASRTTASSTSSSSRSATSSTGPGSAAGWCVGPTCRTAGWSASPASTC